MKPYQERVVKERDDLQEKHGALLAFFNTDTFKLLPVKEANRLRRQSDIMRQYVAVLNERIIAFPHD